MTILRKRVPWGHHRGFLPLAGNAQDHAGALVHRCLTGDSPAKASVRALNQCLQRRRRKDQGNRG
jgi:hypothetical protein